MITPPCATFLKFWFWISVAGSTQCFAAWPQWKTFSHQFVQPDGRVVDLRDNRRTVSEGQAYAAFFALVANDKQQFQQIVNWTENNLAAGDLNQNLPAWLWGKSPQGKWEILDDNSASDADLWLAFSLLEAGRLWQMPVFTEKGTSLLSLVKQYQIKQINKDTTLLLPGRSGFELQRGTVRFNYSYVPFQLIRALNYYDSDPIWIELMATHLKLLYLGAQQGWISDWAQLNPEGGLEIDKTSGGWGSYDALRVYLWVGLENDDQLIKWATLASLYGMQAYVGNAIPEYVNPYTGVSKGQFAPGYGAALLPYWHSLKLNQGQTEQALISIKKGLELDSDDYYQQVLALFAFGWWDGYYVFTSSGLLETKWSHAKGNSGNNLF